MYNGCSNMPTWSDGLSTDGAEATDAFCATDVLNNVVNCSESVAPDDDIGTAVMFGSVPAGGNGVGAGVGGPCIKIFMTLQIQI